MNYTKEDLTLEKLNEEEVRRLIPTVVFLAVISCTGIVGNSLVIYVYKTKYTYTNTRSFILCLSAIDLFSCCFTIPFETATLLKQYTFERVWLCKLSRFCNTLCANSSSFLLVFIAIERFRKVCKPLGWQISTNVSKFLCILSVTLGLSVSLHAIFVYGKQTFYIPEVNMTGSECSFGDKVKRTSIPFLFTTVFGVLFVSGVIILSVLYCLIGQKLRAQVRNMSKSFGNNRQQTVIRNQARSRKTSLLMLVVTLAFVLSFLPHLTVFLIRQLKKDFIGSLSEVNKALYKFVLRSYFLNCAINPIIYSVCDSRFKQACKEVFSRRFNK